MCFPSRCAYLTIIPYIIPIITNNYLKNCCDSDKDIIKVRTGIEPIKFITKKSFKEPTSDNNRSYNKKRKNKDEIENL